MKSIFISSILLVGMICIPAELETKNGVVYIVSPTESLSSCSRNSSCQPGQLCHTMDYLAEHSSELFSPDHVSVTLIFMCGIHNYTKDLTVQNLHSFTMKGAAESRENVIIDHQFLAQVDKYDCTIIQFFNVSFVNVTNLTLRCPAINLKASYITIKSSNIYGYLSIRDTLSFFNITGKGSQALLDKCTFEKNCFITSNYSGRIVVSNSTFQSYRHQINSIVVAFSSVVTLAGNVNFTNSVTGVDDINLSSGTAIFLRTTHPELKSSLNISIGATVYFINLTCNNYGGAVYGENAVMHIGVRTQVIFTNNTGPILNGGALYLINGMITLGAKSHVTFTYNYASWEGGAVWIGNGALIVNSEASLTFSHNSVGDVGGAIILLHGEMITDTRARLSFYNNSASQGGGVYLNNSTVIVNTSTFLFYNNRASNYGGAMYFFYGSMHIITNKSAKFIMNTAQIQGGAIYIESDTHSSITVGNSSKFHLFDNSAFQGGAIYVIPSSFAITVGYQSSVQFINNTALDVGGAVYAEMQPAAPCLFMITDYSAQIAFFGNHANRGIGHHIYGTSVRNTKCDQFHMALANQQGKPYCWPSNITANGYINISFDPGANETLSPVSSAPQRVCLCDSNGRPQCANFSLIFTSVSIYHGETFTLSAHIVGYDFGTTVGIVHAGFLNSNPSFSRLGQSQYNHQVNSSKTCTALEYTVFTRYNREILWLQVSVLPVSFFGDKIATSTSLSVYYYYKNIARVSIADYFSHANAGCLKGEFLTMPVFVNVTLLPGCPPGLNLNHDLTKCSCSPVLPSHFECSIRNKTGFLQWNSTVWVNATFSDSHGTGIIYNKFCPALYCKSGNKTVNIGDDPSKQCASNRIGILCGACKDNFSLAIGSSQCIECPNSHNVALLLAFAAAGVLLVFFILALNLTVTQGLVNRVIFYANIVWAYKMIFFPSAIQKNRLFTFLQVFVAWLNLDFGIECCFFVGLNAYWKTWLQFLFPFYIWAIAGVIIIACRHSSRLTSLIGSRAVPLLATLFLLSYMKLLRTVIDATSVAVIAQYPQNISYAVWYLDGNLRYCQDPHIYLFIAAIATLVFLWLPYTLLLLFIQLLRRVSHLRPFKWINKLAPVYDAYFSPLKDKHRYWFGLMLLVRGILLILLTVTSVANPKLNIFVLFLFIAFLFFFMSIKHVYKRMTVRLLENATLLNLIILSAGTLYQWESTESRLTLLMVSVGIAFAQFCVIVVLNLINPCLSSSRRFRQNQSFDIIDEHISENITDERIEDPELESLINYAPRPVTMTASAKYTVTVTKVST